MSGCHLPLEEKEIDLLKENYQGLSHDLLLLERMHKQLAKDHIQLKKDFESKLDLDYKKWVQYFNEVHPKKSPHKCPVCNGLAIDFQIGEVRGLPIHTKKCPACEGKGIVWG
jgi:hypothetical protein